MHSPDARVRPICSAQIGEEQSGISLRELSCRKGPPRSRRSPAGCPIKSGRNRWSVMTNCEGRARHPSQNHPDFVPTVITPNAIMPDAPELRMDRERVGRQAGGSLSGFGRNVRRQPEEWRPSGFRWRAVLSREAVQSQPPGRISPRPIESWVRGR